MQIKVFKPELHHFCLKRQCGLGVEVALLRTSYAALSSYDLGKCAKREVLVNNFMKVDMDLPTSDSFTPK